MLPKTYPMRYIHTLIGLIAMASLAACSGDAVVSNRYSSLRAYFSYSPVSAVSQLYTACNSMGEWTTITARNSQYIFTNLNGSTPVNRLALQNYSNFYLGLSGLIVGLPNIPELGAAMPVITCYDLACSNCYRDRSITKPLTLQAGGRAYCASCQRTYDLNSIGQVATGNAGINLYRYRVYYGNNTLTVNNR